MAAAAAAVVVQPLLSHRRSLGCTVLHHVPSADGRSVPHGSASFLLFVDHAFKQAYSVPVFVRNALHRFRMHITFTLVQMVSLRCLRLRALIRACTALRIYIHTYTKSRSSSCTVLTKKWKRVCVGLRYVASHPGGSSGAVRCGAVLWQ